MAAGSFLATERDRVQFLSSGAVYERELARRFCCVRRAGGRARGSLRS